MGIKIKRFSKDKEENHDNLKAGLALGASGAIPYGGSKLRKAVNRKLNKSMDSHGKKVETKEDAISLLELMRKAKRKGIKTEITPFEESIVTSPHNKHLRDGVAKEIKKARRRGKSRKEIEEILKRAPKKINPVIKITPDDPIATMAHELGHSHYSKNKTFPDKFHTVGGAVSESLIKSKPMKYNRGTVGFMLGVNSVHKDEDGKIKVKKKDALLSGLYGASHGLPIVISEAMATRKGGKILKEIGASKELQKHYKKQLTRALGTYVTGYPTRGALQALSGHSLGVAAGIMAQKNSDDKESKTKNN